MNQTMNFIAAQNPTTERGVWGFLLFHLLSSKFDIRNMNLPF